MAKRRDARKRGESWARYSVLVPVMVGKQMNVRRTYSYTSASSTSDISKLRVGERNKRHLKKMCERMRLEWRRNTGQTPLLKVRKLQ